MQTRKTITTFITFIAFISISVLIFQSCEESEGTDPQSDNTTPNCMITSPEDGSVITQGESISIGVLTSDADGSITEVRFAVDGNVKATISSSPYIYTWITAGESVGSHTLKATSIDNEEGSTSDEITVQIVGSGNSPPTAYFTVSPASGLTTTNFAFDASGCTDNEDPVNNLQVRWDFDGDGTWDTDWNTDKTQSHQYSSEADYTAKLEVKDSGGLIDQYTKTITVDNGPGTFTDPRDGQIYYTVKIGSLKTWFLSNLNYEAPNSWLYNNSSASGNTYGRLYTWDAALNACPDGWHLPTDDDWKAFEMILGMSQSQANASGFRGTTEGGKMKETGTAHWLSPNTGATNASSFTAKPGGFRSPSGVFGDMTMSGNFWTATTYSSTEAWSRTFTYVSQQVGRDIYSKSYGYSVRCIKD